MKNEFACVYSDPFLWTEAHSGNKDKEALPRCELGNMAKGLQEWVFATDSKHMHSVQTQLAVLSFRWNASFFSKDIQKLVKSFSWSFDMKCFYFSIKS